MKVQLVEHRDYRDEFDLDIFRFAHMYPIQDDVDFNWIRTVIVPIMLKIYETPHRHRRGQRKRSRTPDLAGVVAEAAGRDRLPGVPDQELREGDVRAPPGRREGLAPGPN